MPERQHPLWRTPLNTDWLLFFITFALSLGLTPLFRKIALRTQFLDSPQGQLKKHTAPIPYLGGLAIYFAFLMGILSALILTPPEDGPRVLALLAGGTVMAILGLVDDLFSLGPGIKFLFQVLAAALLILFGVQLEFLPSHPWLGKVLTVFWVLAVTNAVNLIDIMDGLAGGVTVLACLGFALVPALGPHSYVHLTAAALGGSVLGFLPYNYQPARIYMGDSGALFLGFVLAGLAMGHGYSQVNVEGLLAPLLILGIPLYDTALVMFLRFLKGRSMFRGSNDHLALRLRAVGMTVKQVVGTLWGLSILLGIAAWVLVHVSEKRATILLLGLFTLTLLFTVAVSVIPVDEGKQKVRENPFRLFLKPPDRSPRKSRKK
ncbi:MAG TPA: MraY family glycosyltransferase [bacterium]|nr:MraY family glycosyltransferase [bacterium]